MCCGTQRISHDKERHVLILGALVDAFRLGLDNIAIGQSDLLAVESFLWSRTKWGDKRGAKRVESGRGRGQKVVVTKIQTPNLCVMQQIRVQELWGLDNPAGCRTWRNV